MPGQTHLGDAQLRLICPNSDGENHPINLYHYPVGPDLDLLTGVGHTPCMHSLGLFGVSVSVALLMVLGGEREASARPVMAATAATAAPASAASAASDEVQLITGSAKIVRGRVRRARGVATQRALLEAVWQQAAPLLASGAVKGLKRRLGQGVRRLIKRFRTRKVSRAGRRLTVLLAVTVDRAALRRQLRALGARLKVGGVLVLADCDPAPMDGDLAQTLRSVGIRAIVGSWPTPERRTLARAPGKALARGRVLGARVALIASCSFHTVGKIAEAGITAVSVRMRVTAWAPNPGGGRALQLVTLAQTALGHHVDPKQALKLGVTRALGRLGPRLAAGLPQRLPSGVARTMKIKLIGGLPLAEQLTLVKLAARLPGVLAVWPRRFVRRETWLAVRTVHDPARLKQTLSALTPPAGWRLKVTDGAQSGWLDLKAEFAEDQ